MNRSLTALLCLASFAAAQAQTARVPDNPQIDSRAFLEHTVQASALREKRLVSEADFMRMAREPGTVVLDARSERLFRLRHVAGAVNLNFRSSRRTRSPGSFRRGRRAPSSTATTTSSARPSPWRSRPRPRH